MKTITLKSTLNPVFKTTQPLPLLPVGFVAKRAWAARPFSAAAASLAGTFQMDAASSRCTTPLRPEMAVTSARMVA